MGSLVEKQVRFNKARLDLELYLYYKGKINGFYVVLEEAARPQDATYGHPRSTHKSRLAVHYYLYDKDYNWLHLSDPEREKEIYLDAHKYWESRGGAPAIEGDLVHFSFEHAGVR